jgi:uncharacterized protein YqeY
MIIERLDKDIIASMKNKDANKVLRLKNVKAYLIKYCKDNSIREISDDKLYPALSKFINERKKTISIYNEFKNNCQKDQIEQIDEKIKEETLEKDFAISYLPEEMANVLKLESLSTEELEKRIKKIIIDNNFSSVKDLGKLMPILKTELNGLGETKEFGDIAKKLLSI